MIIECYTTTKSEQVFNRISDEENTERTAKSFKMPYSRYINRSSNARSRRWHLGVGGVIWILESTGFERRSAFADTEKFADGCLGSGSR